MMIPSSCVFDQSTLTALLEHDPVVQTYRTFFSLLDWSVVEQWQASRSVYCDTHGHPITAYLKAFLIRIHKGMLYMTQLRSFLLHHPLLIIELGFHLHLDPTTPYGFDPEKTLPCRYWFSQKLRTLDPALLQALLHATVRDLKAEIPGLGEVVAFDVKHIYAWVKENNERVYVPDRYDKTKTLVGDPDCTLGVKRSTNQEQADGSTKEKKEYLWGYGSGVAAATTPGYGDVVLAEYTQPFNENDVTYFEPLYQQSVLALHQFPTHLTADAAFDAWYVYQKGALHHGIAAVPKNQHGHPVFQRDADGTPICPKGLRMTPVFTFQHTRGYRALRFQCPLLLPVATGETCDHAQFAKGIGCKKDVNWELGGLMRVQLDRSGPLYKAIYTQRTSCERINSQAKELGIERPKVRNRRSVANLNTLIYVVINVRTLDRAKSTNRGLLPMS
jgi:Transposase DDE domain